MKKIVRLTESELTQIIKKIVNESLAEQITVNSLTGTSPLKGKSANFYSDPQNTKIVLGKIIIDDVILTRGRPYIKISIAGKPYNYIFNCQANVFTAANNPDPRYKNIYNKQLGQSLYGSACTKNTAGQAVPKADFASTSSNNNTQGIA